jgi:hypothetical protein
MIAERAHMTACIEKLKATFEAVLPP